MADKAKQLVAKWIELFNAHDAEGLAKLYAEDAVNHQVHAEPVRGRAAILQNFIESFRVVPDMGCKPALVLGDGDWAVLEWAGWGSFNAPGGPKKYELAGCLLFQLKDGLIALQKGYWDKQTLFRQIGMKD